MWTIEERARAILARANGEVFSMLDGSYSMRPEARAPSFIYEYNGTLSVLIWGTCDEIQVLGAATDHEHAMLRALGNIAFGKMLEEDEHRRRAIRNPLPPPALEALVIAYTQLFNRHSPVRWGTHADREARERAIQAQPEHKEALRAASRLQCKYARQIAEEALGLHPHTDAIWR